MKYGLHGVPFTTFSGLQHYEVHLSPSFGCYKGHQKSGNG